MDETTELLKASFNRLEGLIGEVRELRYKIKDVQGDVEALRAKMSAMDQAEEEGGERGEGDHPAPEGVPGGEPGGDTGEWGGREQDGPGRHEGGPGDPDAECRCGGSHGSHGGAPHGRGARGGRATDLEARLKHIEEHLQYLGAKWLELDEKIYRLERKGK